MRAIFLILFCLFYFSSTGNAEEVLTLEQSLNLALENNFSIKQAKENILKQSHIIAEARSVFFPKLDLEGSLDKTDQSRLPAFQNNKFGSDSFWTVDIKLSQPLYSAGKANYNLSKQNYIAEASKWELQAIISNASLDVMQKFYNCLLAKAEIEVQKQNVRLSQEQLNNENNRLRAGVISNYNVIRAEVALANSKIPLIKAKNNFKIARLELLKSIGINSEIDYIIPGELKLQKISIASLRDNLEKAKINRAEIKQLQMLTTAAKEGVEIERALYFPSLDSYIKYGADKSRFSDDFSDEVHGWQAGVELNWNIFDSFRTTAKVNQAESELNLTQLQLKDLQEKINLEVQTSFLAITEAEELLLASAQAVKQAEESLRLSLNRQNTGVGTQLETLDSQVALTQAKTNYFQAIYNHIIANLKLKKSVGELFFPTDKIMR